MAQSRTGTTTIGAGPVPIGRLLRKEIAVSVAINLAFNGVFAWLLFPRGRPIGLWGTDGVAFDTLPATVLPALMMTFAITAIMRGRLRKGMLVTGDEGWPLWLPRPLALRALAVVFLALALVALPVLGLLALLWNGPWTFVDLLVFKGAFSVVHAAIVTPIVVLAALRLDRRRA